MVEESNLKCFAVCFDGPDENGTTRPNKRFFDTLEKAVDFSVSLGTTCTIEVWGDSPEEGIEDGEE